MVVERRNTMSWYGGNWNIMHDFTCNICGITASSFTSNSDNVRCHWCKKGGFKTKQEWLDSRKRIRRIEWADMNSAEKEEKLSKMSEDDRKSWLSDVS